MKFTLKYSKHKNKRQNSGYFASISGLLAKISISFSYIFHYGD